MSVRKKPEKTVAVLLGRLSKAKDHAVQNLAHTRAFKNNNYELITSKFDDIGSKLKQMNDSIKNWEKKVVDQLCAVEQALNHEIFTSPSMESLVVQDKLTLIEEDVDRLRSLISMVDQSVTLKLKPRGDDDDDHHHHHHHHTVSQNWIWNSSAMSALTSSQLHFLDNSASAHIKMCLLSLSVFPENTPIRKRLLIYWWIGEGFVTKTGESTAEAAGERVFQDLLNEGFIKPTSTTTNNMNSFLVYPWIRLMLIQLAQKNNFIKFSSDGSFTPCNGKRRAFLRRGAGGMSVDDEDEDEDGERVEDILTVFNADEQYPRTRSEWLSRLHKVVVLQMGRWRDSVTDHIEPEDYKELFKGLGSQKQLKYLSFRGISRIETLPRSIKKLVSLEILDLRACHNLEKLPQEVTELMNLTHLDVSECYLLESMPKGLERLSNLQVLKGFVAGSPSRNSCRISDLARGLKNLRKLSVRVRDRGEEQLIGLFNFSEALRILTISWGVVSWGNWVRDLPTFLTKLDLRSVPFEVVPLWLMPEGLPRELEKLYVTGGKLKLDNINRHDYSNVVKVKRFKYLT